MISAQEKTYKESPIWDDQTLTQWRNQIRGALSIDLFIEWLLKFGPDDIVGHSGSVDRDPLTKFVREYLKNSDIPYIDRLYIGKNVVTIPMPQQEKGLLNFGCSGGYEFPVFGLHRINGSGSNPGLIRFYVDELDKCYQSKPEYEDYRQGRLQGREGLFNEASWNTVTRDETLSALVEAVQKYREEIKGLVE